MTPFDPKWPHGHVTRDGRKATVHCVLKDGRVVATVENEIGGLWTNFGRWYPDSDADRPLDLLNAPAPKRTWEVVAYEYTTGNGVFFLEAKQGQPQDARIIGRYTLTQGEGMDEKNG